MKRVLCLWFPAWPLQRLLQQHSQPEPLAGVVTRQRDRLGRRPWPPLAIYAQHGRQQGQVLYCSRSAQERGVTVGMPRAEAEALASLGASHDASESPQPAGRQSRTGPTSLRLVPHDPAADRIALEALAAWCQARFSPAVSLEETEHPESLALDITGCERLFRGEERLVRQAARACQTAGWVVRAASADTWGAAWAVAHEAQLRPLAQTPSNAPLATELGPSGWQVVPPGNAAIWLARLPLGALRLPADTLSLLAELGLRQVGELARFGRAELAAHLGGALLERVDQALGQSRELPDRLQLVEFPSACWEGETPLTDAASLCMVLDTLVTQNLAALTPQLLGIEACEVALACQSVAMEDSPTTPGAELTTWEVRLLSPSGSARHVLELLSLELQRRRLPGPVERVRLTVTAADRLPVRQQELFAADAASRDPAERARLLERLASRLGPQGVLRAVAVADALPERACRYESWLAPAARSDAARPGPRLRARRARRSRATQPSSTAAGLLPRPLRLLARPRPLAVWATAPTGLPARLKYGGKEHMLRAAWGPERLETGWWRGGQVARDYYQVELADGARWWIFRRLNDGRWFLHGYFA